MEDFLIPVLISWKGPGCEIYVCTNDTETLLESEYHVIWSKPGKLYFRFLVDSQYLTSNEYSTEFYNGTLHNFVQVDSLPDEISQIKYLTLQELEILDQEIFGTESNGHIRACQVNDCFREAAEKIFSLLKMNVERKKFKKYIRGIIKIQAFIKGYLSRKRYKVVRMRFNLEIMRKKKPMKIVLIGKLPRKTLPKRVLSFQEFKEKFNGKGKEKVYQFNLRINKLPLM